MAFRLCWYQASTSQIYYKELKIYPTHTPAMGSDVNANKVIAHGMDILNSEGKIAPKIRHVLEDHPAVQQAWGGSERNIFAVFRQA